MSEEAGNETSDPATSTSSGAVTRARADLAEGREWKARERLVGHLAQEYDAEALELLGEVHHAMRDLPAAGAAWFGTARRGKDVDEAVDAWRERHGDHFDQMWSSLPRSVRQLEGNKRVDALRRRAAQAGGAGDGSAARVQTRTDGSGEAGADAATVIAIALAVVFVACAVIGLVTVLGWLVPG